MTLMPQKHTFAETIARAADRLLCIECCKHYQVCCLAEEAEIVSGGTPSTSDAALWDGGVVWITPKDLGRPRGVLVTSSARTISEQGLSASSARLLPIGTVLFSSRAPIGHVAVAGVPLATNQGFKNTICGPRLRPRFLFHMLRANIDVIAGQGRGNTFMEVPSAVLRDLPIPVPPLDIQDRVAQFLDSVYERVGGSPRALDELPPPLAEQRRIVACLDALAAKIEEAKGLQREIEAASVALLKSLLGQTFDSLMRRGPVRLLGHTCETMTGGTPDRARADYFGGTIPWVKSGELEEGIIDRAGEFITEAGLANSSAKVFRKGTLVVALYGATVGKTGVLGLDASTNQAVCAVVPGPDVHRDYIWWFLRRMRPKYLSQSFGGAQPNISQGLLRDTPIPVPTHDAQVAVVAALDGVSSRLTSARVHAADNARRVEALLPSCLDRAFAGAL